MNTKIDPRIENITFGWSVHGDETVTCHFRSPVCNKTLVIPVSSRLHGALWSQLQNWELIANGSGVHWPDLDEDLSAAGLYEGRVGR